MPRTSGVRSRLRRRSADGSASARRPGFENNHGPLRRADLRSSATLNAGNGRRCPVRPFRLRHDRAAARSLVRRPHDQPGECGPSLSWLNRPAAKACYRGRWASKGFVAPGGGAHMMNVMMAKPSDRGLVHRRTASMPIGRCSLRKGPRFRGGFEGMTTMRRGASVVLPLVMSALPWRGGRAGEFVVQPTEIIDRKAVF